MYRRVLDLLEAVEEEGWEREVGAVDGVAGRVRYGLGAEDGSLSAMTIWRAG